MAEAKKFDYHICSFAPPSVWLRLIVRNGGVPRRYWGRLAGVLGLSLAAAPLRLAEAFVYPGVAAKVPLREAPVFVLGFARAGTTHLHNLLAQDPALGYLDTFQSVVPTFSLVGRGWLRRLMARGMSERERPMDAMAVGLDMPQEEDIAVANASPHSTLHQISFPNMAREIYSKYTLMGWAPEGAESPGALSERESAQWEHEYLRVVRKATIHADGRRLVLKSPVNLGRVDRLRGLFPEAKFIHIVRNPYAIYASLIHMFRTIMPLYQMDDFDFDELEEVLVEGFALAYRKYVEDRELVPAGNLAEVRFEDLERQPLEELERLYAELGLPGWAEAEPAIRSYLGTLTAYRKNTHRYEPSILARVEEKWRFALDDWGYERPPA